MKKILLTLLLMLISIGSYSQKIIKSKKFYDSNNNPYVKCVISNNTYVPIVCMIFEIEYEGSMWDTNRYKNVTVKTNIPIKKSKLISFYITENNNPAIRIKLIKVVYADGTYQTF